MANKAETDERQARRKAALRDNLKRRKAAARKTKSAEPDKSLKTDPSPSNN